MARLTQNFAFIHIKKLPAFRQVLFQNIDETPELWQLRKYRIKNDEKAKKNRAINI